MPRRAKSTQTPNRPLSRVLFVSQRQAENMKVPKGTALISITDPTREPARLGIGWHSVLRVAFDDVDSVTFSGQDGHLLEITADQVVQIAAFVASVSHSCKRLVVHCRHGVSRSAAVAKAVAEVSGSGFPGEYDEYNRFVYLALQNAVRKAWNEA
jgi:predicted protein tyrosine phosphatase